MVSLPGERAPLEMALLSVPWYYELSVLLGSPNLVNYLTGVTWLDRNGVPK
jgi:hypothetical protein